jgi:hypothetical protein
MAVIKSAVELAMERTKNLVLDEKEKSAIAEKETEGRLRAAARRYLEGMTEIDGVQKELKGINADYPLQGSVLIDILTEDLGNKEKNKRLFDLFNIVFSELQQPLKDELEMLRKRFAEQIERREILVHNEIVERLKEEGISGDGLEPNVEAWGEWKEGMEEVNNVFKDRFYEWKNKLKGVNK